MYVKKLSFHVCITYVHMYVSVYICKELQSWGGRISCAATCLTSFLRVFYMHASRIWRRHDWM